MTDDLRAIDRRCAELYGSHISVGAYAHGSGDKPIGRSEVQGFPNFSSDPAAANLLIEDLRKRGVPWMLINHGRGGYYCNYIGSDDIDPDHHCDTWMEAVARFYVAVREAGE